MEVKYQGLEIKEYLEEVKRLLDVLIEQLEPFIETLYQAYLENRLIFLIGNGGNATNASHFAQDLAKGTLEDLSVTKRFRTISLTDNISFITALANDEGYESIFEQQLVNLANPGDLLIAISGSGNSPNILRAVEYANQHGLKTIGITGFDGGRLQKMAQLYVHVPCSEMGMSEALHAVVFHITVSRLRQRLAQMHSAKTPP